jgi:hypothetical protein
MLQGTFVKELYEHRKPVVGWPLLTVIVEPSKSSGRKTLYNCMTSMRNVLKQLYAQFRGDVPDESQQIRIVDIPTGEH